MNQILRDLGIKEENLGSCVGGNNWIDNSDSNYIEIQFDFLYQLHLNHEQFFLNKIISDHY